MRGFVQLYNNCSKWFYSCEEERTANYWSMQESGKSVINLLTDRQNEACSGDGRYYSMSAGVKPGTNKKIFITIKISLAQLASIDVGEDSCLFRRMYLGVADMKLPVSGPPSV